MAISRLGVLSQIFCLILVVSVHPGNCAGYFRRNGEPVNINWVFSLPWDVSNTLRAPLGAPLSLILSSGLAVIMFFGLAVSPVYYLLGTPKRKYNIRDSIINRLVKTGNGKEDSRIFPKNVTYEKESGNLPWTQELVANYPNALESFFWFIGEEDENCQKLMVCHAHGFFNFLPKRYLRYYKIFSRKVVSIPEEYQEAVIMGLDDQSLCLKKYKQCPKDLVTISKNTFGNLVPKDWTVISKTLTDLRDWLQTP